VSENKQGESLMLSELETKRREKQVDKVTGQIEGVYRSAGEVIAGFAELVTIDPGKAVAELPAWIEKARTANGTMNRAYESMAGGPNPYFIMPLINAVGERYASASRENREALLRACLNYFDRLNYVYVQPHVKQLKSGLLVADITINRPVYFPGCEAEQALFTQYRSIPEILNAGADPRSPFFALTVIWQDGTVALPPGGFITRCTNRQL
jgi:hypothetical protein